MSAADDNKDLLVRYFDTIWNKGELSRESEFVAQDIVVHATPIAGIPEGIGGPLQIVGTFRAAVPDIHVRHNVLFAEADKVCHHWTASGTHTGAPLFGVEANGRSIEVSGINAFRVADGRLVERWGTLDMLGLAQQLGLAPDPSAQPA